MELVLIRHFSTPGNLLRQYIGSTDEEIVPYANVEIEYPKVDYIVTSPMKRCIQTAGKIYPNQKYTICEAFRECDFGEYECKTYEELKEEEAYQKWIDSGGKLAFPGGESRLEFQKRSIQGLEEVLEKMDPEKYNSIAIIAHGGTIMSIMEAFNCENKGFYDWQVANGRGFVTSVDLNKWKVGEKRFRNIRKL